MDGASLAPMTAVDELLDGLGVAGQPLAVAAGAEVPPPPPPFEPDLERLLPDVLSCGHRVKDLRETCENCDSCQSIFGILKRNREQASS